MTKIIQTTKRVIPSIYAYTTPEIHRHDGWTKIGYTEQDVRKRIAQQTATADVDYKLEWEEKAVFDGTDEVFNDHAFHAYLQKQDIERKTRVNEEHKLVNTEWFKIRPADARYKLAEFKADRGIIKALGAVPYELRDEQNKAVEQTKEYFETHKDDKPEFLWNAKPRFGKTLTAYDLCKALGAVNILIITNRPAIANSWYDDYVKFLGAESGYYFVSEVDALKNAKHVLSREQYVSALNKHKEDEFVGCIEFVSLQNLKGSKYFNQNSDLDKLGEVANMDWDVLIIDEAHEAIDTTKTDIAFLRIKRKYTLHLSGTPFKALANEKFKPDEIYNWTYADEQKAKAEWDDQERANPYESLPKLNMLTYQMSDIVLDKLKKGKDFDDDGENESFAYDLNEMFKTNASGDFIRDAEVDKFLDALTTKPKFPFSTEELRNELKHTLWLLKYVSSAKALARKLKNHPIFKDYAIVLAAGDGKLDDIDIDNENVDDAVMEKAVTKSYDKVVKAIRENDKTITLSVGQMTTGITIPEWTAVMMLSNVKSPALYMQTAFRAQNPCLFHENGEQYRKENAYVFDFDPARTLTIMEEFANGLYGKTAAGKGDIEERKRHIRELLNYFPIYGEDDGGEMIELDAEKVLSIPRMIHAKEVVRCGFINNYLFQNISHIFNAAPPVINILNKLEPIKNPSTVTGQTRKDLHINENSDTDIPPEVIIGKSQDLFGEKIYGDTSVFDFEAEKQKFKESNDKQKALDEAKQMLAQTTIKQMSGIAKKEYGNDFNKTTQQKAQKQVEKYVNNVVNTKYSDYMQKSEDVEKERKRDIDEAVAEGRHDDVPVINDMYDEAQESLIDGFFDDIASDAEPIIEKTGHSLVEESEKQKTKREQKSLEDNIRDHLRGFSRTIPSFLMAYGDENTCLENFDKIIPANVFLEVTGITIENFRLLRDGGEEFDPETGELANVEGKLFDPVVFNDSVKLFLQKKKELANYFDESQEEDIFDYIPPQKTNQIFTPKAVVQKMLDYLEENDPGCFDNPDKTFIDPYMKSGLYITEIVKRLYKSETIKQKYPDAHERMKHIFEHQVYGLAPTEIIYHIAKNFITGFDENHDIDFRHIVQYDALPAAQAGTLEKELGKVFL